MSYYVRKVILKDDIDSFISDAICNRLDVEQMSPNHYTTYELKTIIEYILYQEFDIETVEEIKE